MFTKSDTQTNIKKNKNVNILQIIKTNENITLYYDTKCVIMCVYREFVSHFAFTYFINMIVKQCVCNIRLKLYIISNIFCIV